MVCPVCNNSEANVGAPSGRDASTIECPQCGLFTVSRTAAVNLRNEDNTLRWKISAWINEFAPSMVTSAEIELARASAVPSIHHRADRMLRWLNYKFPPGKTFSLNELGHWKAYRNTPGVLGVIGGTVVSSPLVPIGWSQTVQEMMFMVADVLCKEMGLLDSPDNDQYQVSPKGLLYLEGRRESVSSVGFCAMWFNAEVLPLWTDVIEPATREAGYEPLRIDSKQHNGKIDDEIMASIRAARFVVSDFTGSRGGVYYEAGFAHGLGLPVIFMCREGDELHFDVRQYNCIFWTPANLEDAKSQLKNRILATLGQGPKLVP